MSGTTSIDHAVALCGAIAEVHLNWESGVKNFLLHRAAIIVAAIAVGSAGMDAEALGPISSCFIRPAFGLGPIVREPTLVLSRPSKSPARVAERPHRGG
jgi:hypothetical protein